MLLFFVFIATSQACLRTQDKTDTGNCVWYGQCGQGFNNGKFNCPANKTTRNAPKLTDPDALKILRQYCPSIYKGDTKTRTCCSPEQIKTFKSSISLPLQILGRCPACTYNLLDSLCQIICSPHQSNFMWRNDSKENFPWNTKDVRGVSVIVTNKFAQGMFDSCKDVEMQTGKAHELFCGRQVTQCSPLTWLNYMGSTSNGLTPFPITYTAIDYPWKSPDGLILQPLDTEPKMCNKTLTGSTPEIGKSKCTCRDCALETCPPPPPPTAAERKHYLDSVLGAGKYRALEVVIKRADGAQPVIHVLPPPSVGTVTFTPIFDKDFLKQVLSLQTKISSVFGFGRNGSVTLDNVCVKEKENCLIMSPLQWYQNNVSDIDKVVKDEYGLFVLADYLDHFLTCAKWDPPKTFDVTYNETCLSTYENLTIPHMVLQGYEGLQYSNATAIVITVILRQGSDAKVKDWEKAFENFIKSYENSKMSITYNGT